MACMPLEVISTIPFAAVLLCVLVTIIGTWHKKDLGPSTYFFALLIYGILALIAAVVCRQDIFDLMRLLCIAIFYGSVLLLLALSFVAFKKSYKKTSALLLLLVLVLTGTAIDAFLIEPKWLETKYIDLESEKISKPIRVAVLSDLQTDKLSDYEKMALQRVLDQNPDIILLPGDYVQINAKGSWNEREDEIKKLNSLLAKMRFTGRLGAFAVRGNVDDPGWARTFRGLPIYPFNVTESKTCGETIITGLSFEDSFDPQMKVAAQNQFHIVFGHGPDFSMGKIDADLLVAGHTHGGQVRVPGFGALITFSDVPQQWGTGGFFEIRPGTHLLVTSGVGHERFHAPRLRFFCHPEIVIINIKPSSCQSPHKQVQKPLKELSDRAAG